MTTHPNKFRLKADSHNWIVELGYWSPRHGQYRWRAESWHPSIGWALRFLHDRLLREGYTPMGIDKMAERVEEVAKRVMEYADGVKVNKDAEISVPESEEAAT